MIAKNAIFCDHVFSAITTCARVKSFFHFWLESVEKEEHLHNSISRKSIFFRVMILFIYFFFLIFSTLFFIVVIFLFFLLLLMCHFFFRYFIFIFFFSFFFHHHYFRHDAFQKWFICQKDCSRSTKKNDRCFVFFR